MVYFCSYSIQQPKEEMPLSPVKVTQLCDSPDLATAAPHSMDRALAGAHSKSEGEDGNLEFLSLKFSNFSFPQGELTVGPTKIPIPHQEL